MLTIDNLTVSFGKKVVLDNLNLALESNKIHGLVGLNGAGKTTLLNTIFGLKDKDSGSVLYNSTNLTQLEY